MRAFSGSRNGCAGVPATSGSQLRVARRYGQQAPQLARSRAHPDSQQRRMTAREEGARVAAPLAPGGILGRGNQPARQLLHVPRRSNLGERIPLHGVRVEGIEHHVPAPAIVEARAIAAVRIGDHRAVAAPQARGRAAPAMAVDLPVPVVPISLKCRGLIARTIGTPASVSCARRIDAAAPRLALHAPSVATHARRACGLAWRGRSAKRARPAPAPAAAPASPGWPFQSSVARVIQLTAAPPQ